MRPIIYPETEEIIRIKKQLKLQAHVEEECYLIVMLIQSCGQPGHTTSASRLCPNHEYTIKERLQMAFPTSYQSYTVSLTLKSFIKQDEGDPNKLLVNYYISNSANNNVEYLSNDIFEKNFWYRVCRLIYGNINIEELQNFYPRLPGIQAAYNRLQVLDNVNLSVEKQGLVGYGQIVLSACDTIATVYNNFYVENYETYIGNYFIYRLKQEYTELKTPLVSKVVYGYVLDEVLQNDTRSDMPEDFITQDVLNSAPNLQAFLNNIIQPVRNRLKIRSLAELQELPRQKGRMFLNSIYTDGYTCRIYFARRVPKVLDEDEVNLEMADFNTDGVEAFFRPCFLDPGRKNAYVAYYGDEQVRSLTLNEYYYSSGSVNRARKQSLGEVLLLDIDEFRTSSVIRYNTSMSKLQRNES
ncbi:hypothetical protein MFLAVUS_000857 [Mucor flavus]|uniref:Uncharacterized protein n=1 Tax=Mucor flavus TaxID=439312 RepID=A0ABP9YKV4_9FUNG